MPTCALENLRRPWLEGSRSRFLLGLAGAVGGLSLIGCQAVVSSPPAAQVRIIAASPDAPGVDLYLNNTVLAYNLGFGSVTSYIAVDANTATVAMNVVGTRQTLASAKNTFVTANQYTVLMGDGAASMQAVVFKDQTQAAPSGQISLRLIDQATHSGALDVYLVPAGRKVTAVTPLKAGITLGTNTGYLNVPTGTYTLVLLATGTAPTGDTVAIYTGAQVAYAGGSATTIIVLDQQLVTTPGVQVISTTDYLSPTAMPTP